VDAIIQGLIFSGTDVTAEGRLKDPTLGVPFKGDKGGLAAVIVPSQSGRDESEPRMNIYVKESLAGWFCGSRREPFSNLLLSETPDVLVFPLTDVHEPLCPTMHTPGQSSSSATSDGRPALSVLQYFRGSARFQSPREPCAENYGSCADMPCCDTSGHHFCHGQDRVCRRRCVYENGHRSDLFGRPQQICERLGLGLNCIEGVCQ